MPHFVEWLVEDQVLLNILHGDITVDDLKSGVQRAGALIDASATQQCSIIIDARHINQYPTDLATLADATRNYERDRITYTILVTRNRILSFLVTTMLKMLHQDHRSYTNPAQALEFLAHDNAQLDLPALADYEDEVDALIAAMVQGR